MDLFHHGGAPDLPAWGSLGASGDLITLAPLARQLEEGVGGSATTLPGRTALAVMNGLSGVTAQIALDLATAMRLYLWGVASSTAAAWALGVRQEAWAEVLHGPPLRHHPGQRRIAALLRGVVAGAPALPLPAGLAVQDPYSLRCIPQALGPGIEQMDVSHRWIAQELDGVSDNPVWTDAAFRSSGHFFGGYVVQAADTASAVVARLGDLLERQTFLLVDGTRGLPENLTTAGRGRHGMKGVHQAASALAMRLQRGAIPSAPFARSAEGHNQDIVSNAMNAATVLTEQVRALAALVAAHGAMAAQALEFRDGWQASPGLAGLHEAIRRTLPPLEDDDLPLREPLAALAAELAASAIPTSWPALWEDGTMEPPLP
jgi:tyrosine ammonia-lyase